MGFHVLQWESMILQMLGGQTWAAECAGDICLATSTSSQAAGKPTKICLFGPGRPLNQMRAQAEETNGATAEKPNGCKKLHN